MKNHSAPRKHFRTCNLCEAMCGIVIEHKNKEVVSIKGDKEDPLSRGHICPKAYALLDLYEDPDRLKKPIKKVNGEWHEIPWEQAYDEVAQNLLNVQEEHGKNAVGVYSGNPSVHNYGTILMGSPFFRAIGSKNMFSATSVDQLPHHFVSQTMLGHWLLLPVPDLDRTDYFLILGGNPLVSNGSMMTAPDISKRLRGIQKRGKVVVIDPRKTETAAKADEHHFIVPGTDVYFLLGIVKVLFDLKKVDLGAFKDKANGLKEIQQMVTPLAIEILSKKCQISSDVMRRIAQEFAESSSAACYGRMGVSVQSNGTLCQWLIYSINILTNNFDKAGGVMFTSPAVPAVRGKSTLKRYNRWQSRVRKLPEFSGELPVATLGEEILTPGNGQIKAMVISAGNPVLSTPNGIQLDKAFNQLDYMVSIDIYLNETSRHADIILPPVMGLESDHYDLVFNNFSVRNTIKYSRALFTPPEGTQYDWQIYKALEKRINKKHKSFITKLFDKWKTPKRLLNLAIMMGPYGILKNKRINFKGLRLASLKKYPHGKDLGPLKPTLGNQIRTVDKKINLLPDQIKISLKELILNLNKKDVLEGLKLISRRHLLSNNSWNHNLERMTRGRDRCTLLVNPVDASKRNIEDKQIVNVKSRVGQIEVSIELTDEIMVGTVCLPHGYGHNRQGTNIKHAQKSPGVSINDLNDDQRVDPITGNAAFSGTEVTIEV